MPSEEKNLTIHKIQNGFLIAHVEEGLRGLSAMTGARYINTFCKDLAEVSEYLISHFNNNGTKEITAEEGLSEGTATNA